ncbi:MAG: hypothetical protein PVG39_09350 [Desulfobacteraceae bacterium]|jgi:hypothetical protein
MTVEGDLVLIYFKDEPEVYARIERIEADIKKDWYQVTFLLLTIPRQTITWILREEYISGSIFTMSGNNRRIEKIERLTFEDETDDQEPEKSTGNKKGKKPAKIVPFKRKD